MNEPHVTESIPAYALHCLDAQEEAAVKAHLAHCPACRAELQAYTAVTDQLRLAVPLLEPPADLKARVLAQTRPAASPRPALTPTPQRPSWLANLKHLFNRPVWQPVAAVVIVLLLISNVLLWRRLSTFAEPADFPTQMLLGTAVSPDATGLIIMDATGEYGTLVVQNLPQLDDEHAYQLWLVQDGARDDGGVFWVDDDGYGSMWIHAPEPLRTYTRFGITVEPKEGSPGPTGAKVLGN